MSRFGSTITDSDRKILSSLFNPYEWYSPSPKISPQFEQQSPFGQPFGGQVQGLQSQFQQQKPLEQQAPQQQGVQQFQQPMQQLGMEQKFQQPLQQDVSQQQFQQGFQQQQFQPIAQGLQQQYQPAQQQQFLPQQQLQQDQFQQGMQQQFQQPLQQQGIQQFQQPMQQQLGMDQQIMQPFQKEMLPSDAAFQQGLSTFMGQGPQQLGFFPEMPSTVFFEIRDIDRVGGKEKKEFYEEKHKGKRIPIVETRDVSLMQGNWNEWQKEAQKCIDKILKLNHKAYNQFQHLQNFKLMESGINYQNDVDNWMNRLKKNLDNLVKENERLRAELSSGSWGSKGGFQGVRGGVDLQVGNAVDFSHVIKPSDIKKSHVTTEKIAQWHPQPEKHTFTEKVKDTAIGFATTVENAALHPIESVGKIASTVEQVALHPIQTVEKAADAVVHTVM